MAKIYRDPVTGQTSVGASSNPTPSPQVAAPQIQKPAPAPAPASTGPQTMQWGAGTGAGTMNWGAGSRGSAMDPMSAYPVATYGVPSWQDQYQQWLQGQQAQSFGPVSSDRQQAGQQQFQQQAQAQQAGQQQQQQYQQGAAYRTQNMTGPPKNPAEALAMQWYGSQQAQDQQIGVTNQALTALGQGQQAQSQDWAQNQARNEGLMREGMATQQQEVAAQRQQQQAMLDQQQGTYQWLMGLLRRGGENSLATFMSPVGQQMAQGWQAGNWTPQQYGGFFEGMQGQMDPSSQFYGQQANVLANTQFTPPDMSAWANPEAYRTSWLLPNQSPGYMPRSELQYSR